MPPPQCQMLNPNELQRATPPPVRLVKAGVPVCLAALFIAHDFKRKKSLLFCTLEHCLKQELGEHFQNLHTQQI